MVRGKLSACSVAKGSCAPQKRETDVHKFAHTDAVFNWRWKFPVEAPTQSCTLELSLVDKDVLSANDLIYAKKILPLDHMLMLALDHHANGKPALGVNSEKVIFDAWPKRDVPVEPPSTWWCSWRRRTPEKPAPATLRVDVQILPKEDADLDHVDEGQISEPHGRLSWNTGLAAPLRVAQTLVGPTHWRNGGRWCCCLGITSLVLLIFVLAFLFINTFVKPFS
jgi:hypothetical protein